jgi:hypothetical protein
VLSIPYLQLPKKVTGLVAMELTMPAEVFNSAGQTKVDTSGIDLRVIVKEYDEVMIHKCRISLEEIRKHTEEVSF